MQDNKAYLVATLHSTEKDNAFRMNLLAERSENVSENTELSYLLIEPDSSKPGGIPEYSREENENLGRMANLGIFSNIFSRTFKTPIVIKGGSGEKRSDPTKWMFSLAVGVAVFRVLSAVHLRDPETRSEAVTLLLENGCADARVRDVEILATVMKLGEFTIPEVIRKVGTSKATAYRTIDDLVDMGIVEKKEKSYTGNARGKPSRICKFKGKVKLSEC